MEMRAYTHPDEAWAQAQKMPFAWIHCYSTLYLGTRPESVDASEVVEARFFDGTGEVRFFRTEGVLQAAWAQTEAGDFLQHRTWRLKNAQFGKTITITTVLQPDEDGQMYPSAMLLTGWEGGQNHGL